MHCRDKHTSQGAVRQGADGAFWRTWAPFCNDVTLVTFGPDGREEFSMTPEGDGYFVHRRAAVEEGMRYAFRLGDGREFPDPASRWQPEGVHRPSAVFFPDAFHWSDDAWRGIARHDLVIYELHVGTFTPEGTFDAIIPRLPELLALGVTVVELMPVGQFAGDRNWGYDGVFPYAVQNSYGGPRALQRLVDSAPHRAGMAVILDVVFNHFGCEGNYSGNFGPYFTDRYHTPWSTAINFDGPDCEAVRQFAVDNARMWVRNFHLDGLRLDAVQTIYDLGARHILAEIQQAVQAEAAGTMYPWSADRQVHTIAESDQNVRLLRSRECGGYGLDAVWADDFHHSVHVLLTGEHDGYYADFGRAEQLAKAYNDVFVYDGCYSRFRRRRHGGPAGATDRTRFVVCIQNHDQVGNRARGERLGALVVPAAQRLACGLLLLSPCVPLLFMGEEYGEERPFPFFTSFQDPLIIDAVRQGRRREFAEMASLGEAEIPDPQDPRTFAAAKLTWAWPDGSSKAQLRRLYQDLLLARRRWPPHDTRQQTVARLVRAADSPNGEKEPSLLVIEQGAGTLAVANLSGAGSQSLAEVDLTGRELLLSTEETCYGGCRRKDDFLEQILPHELLVFTMEGTRP